MTDGPRLALTHRMIIDAIAKQDWFDDIGDLLRDVVHGALAGDTGRDVKNALHGTWLGHPLHPVLTDIPIGAWTVALVLDALEGLGGSEGVAAAADGAIAIGLLGALGSAITGLTDLSETDGRARRVGVVHGLLNAAATTLYATSFVMRRSRRRRAAGVSLSMLGYAIAGASAYLGGHLVFGEQIGVDHTATADSSQPEDFTAVMDESELKADTPTRADAGDIAVVLVKRDSRIFALSHTCPHLGGPLSEGKLVGDAIQCPWHQSELALDDGHVVNGPTTFPARCFDVRVRNGKIEVRARPR